MTLRGRLTWMLLLTLAPLGAAAGLGLYVFVRSSLIARLDDALTARAEALAAMVKSKNGALEFDFEDGAMPQYQSRPESGARQTAYFEVYRLKNGELDGLVERSPSLGARTLLGARRVPTREAFWNSELSGDLDVRVMARRAAANVEADHQLEPDESPDSQRGAAPSAATGPAHPAAEVLLVVAVSRETVEEPLEALATALPVTGVVLIAVGWLTLRGAIFKGLQPVNNLAEQVAAINPANLGMALRVQRLPPEVVPIQDRVNALLARIEAAMQREKRFTTAAAHELRTPVAELRTLLEVAASRPRSAEESGQTVSAALSIVEQLDRLVAALLHLTRIESGRESAAWTVVPVVSLVEEVIHATGAIATGRGTRFRVTVPQELTARADVELLRLALGNIVANAAEYADASSEVEITAHAVEDGVAIRITNHAASLAGVDSARIGEPLWCPDQARVRTGHLGLGLALARAALHAMSSTLVISSTSADTNRVVVDIGIGRTA
ncbi:MAG: ATP-binding protein [Phycisphaerales bacterium]